MKPSTTMMIAWYRQSNLGLYPTFAREFNDLMRAGSGLDVKVDVFVNSSNSNRSTEHGLSHGYRHI